jgi:hypothetical protein
MKKSSKVTKNSKVTVPNEEKEETVEPSVQQPQSKFTTAELSDLLLELSDTKYWAAILAYDNGLKLLSMQTLFSVDPFKNPTLMAQQQGFIQALGRLPEYVETEKQRRKNKESETDINSEDSNINMGYGN